MLSHSSHLFGIKDALLQKVTHEGVCMAECGSSESVVSVSVPLKLKPKLDQIRFIDSKNQKSEYYQTIHILNHTYFRLCIHGSFYPFEAFIKSPTSRPILVPLPWANIYHRLKVHLLVHQSFGDLCCLLEMDIVYRKDSAFSTWLNIKAQVSIKANRVQLCKALMCYLVHCWELGLPHAQKLKRRVFGWSD